MQQPVLHAHKFADEVLLDFQPFVERAGKAHDEVIHFVVVGHAGQARVCGGGDEELLGLNQRQMLFDFGHIRGAKLFEQGLQRRQHGIGIHGQRHGNVESVDHIRSQYIVALHRLGQQQAVGKRHGFAAELAHQNIGADLHHQRVEKVDVDHAPAQAADFDVVAHGILLGEAAQKAAGKAHNQLFGGQHDGRGNGKHREREGLDLRGPHADEAD